MVTRPKSLSQGWHISDGHEVYYETVGTPGAVPAVFLHGGPGSGCQPGHRELFDPDLFHAVLIDQRGAGRSRPAGALEANTTEKLVGDMEAIRAALGFEKWLLVGGSWGATLALAYAQRHPHRVSGLVLRAVFLGTRAELDWAFGTALATFHPALYDDFLSLLPESERGDPLNAYWQRILDGSDARERIRFIRAWHGVERVLSAHYPAATRLDLCNLDSEAGPVPATPKMEAHYFSHGCFIGEGAILTGARCLANIPGTIIQGRYDLLCPPSTSARLAAAWDGAEIETIEVAGHSMGEPLIREALSRAVMRMGCLVAQ